MRHLATPHPNPPPPPQAAHPKDASGSRGLVHHRITSPHLYSSTVVRASPPHRIGTWGPSVPMPNTTVSSTETRAKQTSKRDQLMEV